MSQHSNTLRKRVLDEAQKADDLGRYSANKERLSRQQIADKFNISINTLKDWIRLKKISDEDKGLHLWKTKKRGLRGSKVLDLIKLEEYIKENPDKYLEEIAEEFSSNDSTISYWMIKMGFGRKKNKKFMRKLIPLKNKNI